MLLPSTTSPPSERLILVRIEDHQAGIRRRFLPAPASGKPNPA